MQIHNVGARQFKLGMRLDYHMSTLLYCAFKAHVLY